MSNLNIDVFVKGCLNHNALELPRKTDLHYTYYMKTLYTFYIHKIFDLLYLPISYSIQINYNHHIESI